MEHKHAKVIQAAINNRFIQIGTDDGEWKPPISGHDALSLYSWAPSIKYRIAVESVTKYQFAYKTRNGNASITSDHFKNKEQFKSNYPTTEFQWVVQLDPTAKVFEEEIK